MRIIVLVFIFSILNNALVAQESPDSTGAVGEKKIAEDPSQMISRVEVFNEFQHYNSGINLNITTFRTVIRFAKRFTTRIEIPFVYNSKNTTEYAQKGISDISFRLLGFRIYESKKDAISLSIEASLNTAASPLLGTGKNIILFMGTYTRVLIPKRVLLAGALQQANSVSGDKTRNSVSFTKVQAVLINFWSKKTWTTLSPECYLDYVKGGVSMNLEGRFAYAPKPRINLWIKAGCGLFGDFIARYQWTAEIGARRFF